MAKGTLGYKVRTITCVHCGTVVTKRMPSGRRFCSLECYRVAPRPERQTGKTITCAQCGVAFYAPTSRPDAEFCTNACHNTYQRRNRTHHTCKMCGCDFEWSPSRTASGNYQITYCSLACRDADPERTTMLLRMNQTQQLGRMTRAEVAGYAMLDKLGVAYVPQANFAGKFTPDAVMPSARLVIQFDGDYWHDRKGGNTEPRIMRRVANDQTQDAYIRACGWGVVRFWETDLRDNPAECAERLSHAAQRPLGVAPSRDPLARV